MEYYEKKKELAHKAWELSTDSNNKTQADKDMTEYLNYCQFVDQPELQARVK